MSGRDKAARQSEILAMLRQEGTMRVGALAQHFRISQQSIRKDLNVLERSGLVRRIHGAVVIGGGEEYSWYSQRRLIAQIAPLHLNPRPQLARRPPVGPGAQIEAPHLVPLRQQRLQREHPNVPECPRQQYPHLRLLAQLILAKPRL